MAIAAIAVRHFSESARKRRTLRPVVNVSGLVLYPLWTSPFLGAGHPLAGGRARGTATVACDEVANGRSATRARRELSAAAVGTPVGRRPRGLGAQYA